MIEVHCCYYPSGLLGGLGAWHGGSRGTFLREVVVSVGLAVLFPSFSLRRGVAHERMKNSLHGKGMR